MLALPGLQILKATSFCLTGEMQISPFAVEQWMNEYENHCDFNLAETCVESLTVEELLDLAGVGRSALDDILSMKLTYGAIKGSDRLRTAIAALYDDVAVENVLVTHGAIGANKLVHETLVEPGNAVISVQPTYQQHYSIPASYGAKLHILRLRAENGYLPDLAELRAMATPDTVLIAINNPNNPTGSLMNAEMLAEIAEIARASDAYVLCDEVYRGTDQAGSGTSASIVEVSGRGISTGSMSKAFSLAGLRLGWMTAPVDVINAAEVHRDYSTISVSMINDFLAAIALENADTILERSRSITRTNLAILTDWVEAESRISWVKPQSGTTALLQYDSDISSREFCSSLLRNTGVLFMPGSALESEGSVRIGYANSEQILRDGLAQVSLFLNNL